jgi:hypothetical protein
MSPDELEKTVTCIHQDAESGSHDAAWTGVDSLLRAQQGQDLIGLALVSIVESGILPIDKAHTTVGTSRSKTLAVLHGRPRQSTARLRAIPLELKAASVGLAAASTLCS